MVTFLGSEESADKSNSPRSANADGFGGSLPLGALLRPLCALRGRSGIRTPWIGPLCKPLGNGLMPDKAACGAMGIVGMKESICLALLRSGIGAVKTLVLAYCGLLSKGAGTVPSPLLFQISILNDFNDKNDFIPTLEGERSNLVVKVIIVI